MNGMVLTFQGRHEVQETPRAEQALCSGCSVVVADLAPVMTELAQPGRLVSGRRACRGDVVCWAFCRWAGTGGSGKQFHCPSSSLAFYVFLFSPPSALNRKSKSLTGHKLSTAGLVSPSPCLTSETPPVPSPLCSLLAQATAQVFAQLHVAARRRSRCEPSFCLEHPLPFFSPPAFVRSSSDLA